MLGKDLMHHYTTIHFMNTNSSCSRDNFVPDWPSWHHFSACIWVIFSMCSSFVFFNTFQEPDILFFLQELHMQMLLCCWCYQKRLIPIAICSPCIVWCVKYNYIQPLQTSSHFTHYLSISVLPEVISLFKLMNEYYICKTCMLKLTLLLQHNMP